MRKATILLVVALVAAILPAAAMGQSGITWDTEIVIMNLGVDTAYVTVYYYDLEDGMGSGGLNTQTDYTIDAGASIKFTPAVASGFNGSAVVESTEPIAVIVNEMGDPATYTYNASYMGFDAGSDEVRLPALMSCNSGYYTFFNVQNAGSATTTVTVDYIDWLKPADFTPINETVELDPGEAHTFTQEPGSANGQFPARADCYTSAYRWIGGAKITSTGGVPVVATANQVHADASWGMSSYSGFTGVGSTSVILPAIMYENAPDPAGDRYWSGVAVANVGDATTTITYSFYPKVGAAVSNITKQLTPDELDFLLMGEQRTFDAGLVAGAQWVGTIVIDGGGEELMVMTNQLSNKRGELSAWKGIDPLTATDTIALPLIMSDSLPGAIWWTGFMVYNLDPTNPALVTVSYTPGATCTPANEQLTLAPETSEWWLQSGDWSFMGFNNWDTCGEYFGNATVTSDAGQPIVAIVSVLGSSMQDTGELTNSYNGLNR